MNIFVTSKYPIACAKALDDKRVIKMTLESCQLLSTALHPLNISGAPYRKSHDNHPCAKFTQASQENYNWVLAHFEALCHEYTYRFDKVHACEKFICLFKSASRHIQSRSLTPFVNCTNFSEEKSVYTAYKKTLCAKWLADKRSPTWRKRRPPAWL